MVVKERNRKVLSSAKYYLNAQAMIFGGKLVFI
jgi:hypothetical protein